ncbi:hypothetical protein QQP08_003799 [Theobroma cacao]|nr:hypothetical protein QQP08_003799 [Theobroma cacao]
MSTTSQFVGGHQLGCLGFFQICNSTPPDSVNGIQIPAIPVPINGQVLGSAFKCDSAVSLPYGVRDSEPLAAVNALDPLQMIKYPLGNVAG